MRGVTTTSVAVLYEPDEAQAVKDRATATSVRLGIFIVRHPSEWQDEALFWSHALGRLRSILERIEAGAAQDEDIAGKNGQPKSGKDIKDRHKNAGHGGGANKAS
jgi:hypothetical protein